MKKSVIPFAALLLTAMPNMAAASPIQDSFSTVANSIGFAKFRRFFSFTQIAKAELTLAIENGLLLQATDQSAQGNVVAASATLQEFKQERTSLQTELADLTSSTPDHATTILIRDVLADEALQLDDLKTVSLPEAAGLESETVGDIDRILEKTVISPDERMVDLATVSGSSSRSADKAEAKVAKKLILKNELDDATVDPELKTELAHQEDSDLSVAANLDPNQLSGLVALLSDQKAKHNLVALQKLLVQSPEPLKPILVAALDDQAQKESGFMDLHPDEADKLSRQLEVPMPIRDSVLTEVESKSKNATTKGRIEHARSNEKTQTGHGMGVRTAPTSGVSPVEVPNSGPKDQKTEGELQGDGGSPMPLPPVGSASFAPLPHDSVQSSPTETESSHSGSGH